MTNSGTKAGIVRYASPLGTVCLSAEEACLTGLWFAEREPPRMMERETPLIMEQEEKRLPVLKQAVRWLDLYFSGQTPTFTPPYRLSGTPFQMAVWSALSEIPYGTTVTYGELARKLSRGKRMSPQAVGGALARNPIAILIPCHRVVGADGTLTGYAWGLERKQKLLEWEQGL